MENFWLNNSIFYALGLVLFPRLSLLFCTVPGSIFFWLGWFFLPRITIAILATLFYSSTNPFFVILSWIFAFGGESAEKKYGYKMTKKKDSRRIDNAEYEVVDE